MTILHLDSGREMRGGQWQALQLMRMLRKRGHNCLLLAQAGSPLLARAYTEDFYAESLTWATLLAHRKNAAVTHAHDAKSHSMAALVGCRPLAVSRRVAFPIHGGPASRWKYRRADHFIAVSEFVKGRLQAAGVPEEKITVVPDGVDPLPVLPPNGRIVALASDDPGKCGELLRSTSLDLRFSTNLTADLPGARAFVYLSEAEGLGSAALLAMSAGVPVVASRVGGLPEAVADGETGILTENRAEAVEEAVARLLGDEAMEARMRENARARYLERFTVDCMVDGTEAVYRQLTGEKPAAQAESGA